MEYVVTMSKVYNKPSLTYNKINNLLSQSFIVTIAYPNQVTFRKFY